MSKSKICVVGAGNVGSALTFSLASSGFSHHVDLYARNSKVAEAAILDAMGAYPDFSNISAVQELEADYDILVITAGVQHSEEQTKLEMLASNYAIAANILDKPTTKKMTVIVIGSPVDELTRMLGIKYPQHTIIGFGGELDKARLTYALRIRNIDSAFKWIIGEHGKRAIPVYETEEGYEQVAEQVSAFLSQVKKATPTSRNLATGNKLRLLLETLTSGADFVHCINSYHRTYETWLTWPWKISNGRLVEPLDIRIGPKAQELLDELIRAKSIETELDETSIDLGSRNNLNTSDINSRTRS